MSAPKYPPRIFVEFVEHTLSGKLVPFHTFLSLEAAIKYGAEFTESFISIQEHEALLREAKAEVWEEARKMMRPGSLERDHVTQIIQQLRAEKGKP